MDLDKNLWFFFTRPYPHAFEEICGVILEKVEKDDLVFR